MLIQGIIFDMDGLMFDTERVGYNYMMKIVSLNGYDMPKSVLNKTLGVNKKKAVEIFKEYLGEAFPAEKLLQKKREMVNAYFEKNGIPIKTGLLNLLEFLDKNNVKKAVATSSNRTVTENLLRKANVYERFDVIVCGNEIKNSKPEPDVFLKAHEKLNLPKENILILEDSRMGILAAYRAEIKSIMVPDILPADETMKKFYFKEFESLIEVKNFFETNKDFFCA